MDWAEIKARIDHGEDGSTELERTLERQLQEFYNAFGYILTEEQTIAGASVSDIELAAFWTHLTRQGFDVVAEPEPAVEDDLCNRGVLAEFDGALRPTLYGLLAFGKYPQLAPQTGNFWIECVAYGGNDQAAGVILVSEAKGRLDEQLDRGAWLGPRTRAIRATRRGAAEGQAAAAPEGDPRGPRQRRCASRLRNHRVKDPIRGVLRPRAGDEPRGAARPHDSRGDAHRRANPIPERADGELHARPPVHGAARGAAG